MISNREKGTNLVLTLVVMFLFWLATFGCVSGSKGLDLSRQTKSGQRTEVVSTAGDNSRITTINLIGQNSGWIISGLTTLGWGTAWMGRRRSTKAVDRLVRAIGVDYMEPVKKRVKQMGKISDRTEACINERIRVVCR